MGSPRASLAIVHGLGEHAGRYAEVASFFTSRGFQVWAYDQQGHGRDSGSRGVASSYEHLLEEVGCLLRWAVDQLPGLPCYLLGHSMGGNLAINYALRNNSIPNAVPNMVPGAIIPSAIVASSPMLRTRKEPKGLLNRLARVASTLVPNFCIPTGIKSSSLTNNTVEQEIVDRDPLYHRKVSLRLGSGLIDSGRWAIANAHLLRVPTLITHGSLDQVTMPEGSSEFAASAGAICRFELLQNHLHETFRDIGGERVLELWADFFEAHSVAQRDTRDH